MQFPKQPALAVLLAAGLSSAQCAQAQTFPSKPIQVVTTTAGGGADLISRTLAQGLTESLGPAVVINAGSQIVPMMTVAKAAPDGHTLLSYGGNTFWLYPFLDDKSPYDPVKDFAPVTLTASAPNLLVVHPAVPANNVKELIAVAKAKPGALNYGTAGVGASPWLAGELFKAMSGTNIVNVRYKGIAPAIADTVAGRLLVIFSTVGSVMSQVKAGKLRALAVTSARPTELAPGMPTVAASGVPGYESTTTYVVFAPAKTPGAIIDRLSRTMAQYLNRPEVKTRLFNEGFDVVGSTPQELATAMKADMDKMGKVIRDAGITRDE